MHDSDNMPIPDIEDSSNIDSIENILYEAKKGNWKELSLKKKGLKSIPSNVFNIESLEILDVSNNHIAEIPPDIARLPKLRVLLLSGNQVKKISHGMGQLINLKELNLSGCRLTSIPNGVLQPENLEIIHLDNNRILEIPADIRNLSNLRVLTLSSNVIKKLPDEIGQLHKLRYLKLERNSLRGLPEKIVCLRSLKKINLSRNEFTKFPKIIKQIRTLRSLNISHNNFNKLPSGIENLYQLKDLELTACGLTAIPLGITKLSALESLHLENNGLTDIPIDLKNLEQLKYLDLSKNLLPIPSEILDVNSDPEFILDYYFSSIKKLHKLNEVKLLLVGQGSVGKTSLVQQILYGSFTPNQIKTEGISINIWQIRGRKKYSSIKVNTWDFGGQEIMHATHQFFLTKRSLYLLVLDSRLSQEENRVEYWLKIIQSFGGDSPVLIIGNKTDQHPLDIDRSGLQKKYPNIVGILETSAATGSGIEELKSTISEQVRKLPHVRDLLPENWFTVKTALEKLGLTSNFITLDKYSELCIENEVSDEINQRMLIRFLHDLGVVLHFQDDPRLEALGILNPQWVTNGVYKILNSHTLFQNKGVLTVSMLNEILQTEDGYPRDKRLFIVDMMKKFELCYDLETDKSFLVPDLLPKDEPATDGRENALAFQYHYAVLPSSVITRFIVRMNGFVAEKVWRTGAILKDGGNTALVKADIEDRKVFIWVSGNEHKRHDFLSKIRGQFDAIHKTISKLEVKEMVPVPNHPEAEPVDYDLLLQMDHNNVEVYPVLSGGKMIVVNVRSMLNGVAREADRQRGSVTNFYIGGDMKDSTIISGNENEVNK
jgi:internalin A